MLGEITHSCEWTFLDGHLDFSAHERVGMSTQESWAGFAEPNPALIDHSIGCFGAGAQQGHVRTVSKRTLTNHGLVYVSRGSGHYFDSQNPAGIRIVGPCLLWLFPGAEHTYGPDESGWVEHWVLFGGSTVAAFERLAVMSPHRPVEELRSSPELLALVESLFVSLRAPIREHDTVGALTASAVVAQLLAATASLPRLGPSDEAQSRQLMSLLARDASLALSVAERAQRLGLTEEKLRRVVRAHGQQSPVDFITGTRMSRAQELLLMTHHSVQHVGQSVGYEDPAYFTRAFTRHVGVSPSQYRNQHGFTPE